MYVKDAHEYHQVPGLDLESLVDWWFPVMLAHMEIANTVANIGNKILSQGYTQNGRGGEGTGVTDTFLSPIPLPPPHTSGGIILLYQKLKTLGTCTCYIARTFLYVNR